MGSNGGLESDGKGVSVYEGSSSSGKESTSSRRTAEAIEAVSA